MIHARTGQDSVLCVERKYLVITWITSAIGRWTTPDPEEELMVSGYVITDNAGLILVDPPVLSWPAYFLASLGPVRAILLTTHDHTRWSRCLSDLLSGPRQSDLIETGYNLAV